MLSSLSVSNITESRLHHRCSTTYLRISPLHVVFRFPLMSSSSTVSMAASGLSPEISPSTCRAAYAPFTPSQSDQRFHPPYYRSCWHGVSRWLFFWYCQISALLIQISSSQIKEVYNPKTFILHAALLLQAFAHWAIFPTAASRRSLGSVSVPVSAYVLSDRLLVIALVSSYLTN